MKKTIFLVGLFLILFSTAHVQAQEVKIISVIESLVEGGVGRSRIVESTSDGSLAGIVAKRKKGSKNADFDKKRGDIKIEGIEETFLLNYYSLAGINFQNIASNDAILEQKIADMFSKGWDLKFVASSTEAQAGKSDKTGIQITRFIFYKK